MFTEAEISMIDEALRHSIAERSSDVVAMFALHGTLSRLHGGGLHVRDLEAIRDTLQSDGQRGLSAQCMDLIAKLVPLIEAAPPFPQPVATH